MYHVRSAIPPESLRSRLECDLKLSHYQLRKDFRGFMAHAVKLSEAFQLVENGGLSRKKKTHPGGDQVQNTKSPKSDHENDKQKSNTIRRGN